MNTDWLAAFVDESNRIEGISRAASYAEIKVTEEFIALESVTVEALTDFVSVVAPGNRIRDQKGLNVRVGNHIPMPGGMAVPGYLGNILYQANRGAHPYRIHHEYESLHPFTDGNGRSGRALWLWMMLRTPYAERAKALGFLHTWYYQSLENGR